MSKVMMTITGSGGAPSLEEIKQQYNLGEDEIDPSFGVVEVDPEERLYTIMVEQDAAAKVQGSNDWATAGPYANPRIATFGPSEDSGDW